MGKSKDEVAKTSGGDCDAEYIGSYPKCLTHEDSRHRCIKGLKGHKDSNHVCACAAVWINRG